MRKTEGWKSFWNKNIPHVCVHTLSKPLVKHVGPCDTQTKKSNLCHRGWTFSKLLSRLAKLVENKLANFVGIHAWPLSLVFLYTFHLEEKVAVDRIK